MIRLNLLILIMCVVMIFDFFNLKCVFLFVVYEIFVVF